MTIKITKVKDTSRFVAVEDGVAVAHAEVDLKNKVIRSMFVKASHRRKGIGTRLIRYIADHYKRDLYKHSEGLSPAMNALKTKLEGIAEQTGKRYFPKMEKPDPEKENS